MQLILALGKELYTKIPWNTGKADYLLFWAFTSNYSDDPCNMYGKQLHKAAL